MYLIEHYQTQSGRVPYLIWFSALRNIQAQKNILRRLNRLALGNFGDCKPCRDGIWEIRVDTGQGYRLYYALYANQLVVLLCGGDKSTQQADINQACKFWKDWQAR
jgi:putative addiction module killer protein